LALVGRARLVGSGGFVAGGWGGSDLDEEASFEAEGDCMRRLPEDGAETSTVGGAGVGVAVFGLVGPGPGVGGLDTIVTLLTLVAALVVLIARLNSLRTRLCKCIKKG
jgi:hypothetical protein